MESKPEEGGTATRILDRLRAGDTTSSEELFGVVYAELRRLAESHMARQADHHTLQPTALVHEAWMRLVDQSGAHYENRKAFFAMASRVMRNLLVDHARARRARNDRLGRARVTLAESIVEAGTEHDVDLLALDEALEQLGATDAELLRVVELRFFGGLTSTEAAEVLGMPLRSFERALQVARLWLAKRLKGGDTAQFAT